MAYSCAIILEMALTCMLTSNDYLLWNMLISIIYIMNIAGFIMMKVDKKRAIKHQYRISERTFGWWLYWWGHWIDSLG